MRIEIAGPGYSSRTQRTLTVSGRVLEALRLDGPLLLAALAVCVAGLVVLFSAAGEDMGVFLRQAARVGLGLGVMVAVAQVPPRVLRAVAPWLAPGGRVAHWKGARLAEAERRAGERTAATLALSVLPDLRFEDDAGPAHLVVYARRAAG